jgi:iron complex transport system ATP-binding protein
MNRTILNVSGLRVERGDTVILADIFWRVVAGQHWVMLGANGSGKTTLLSALTGYISPTYGEIKLLGQRYGETDWRELRKRIGLVSSSIRQLMSDSELALDTVLSGKFAVIDFWGEASRADRQQARQILRQIECEHLAARLWGVLSQGERQRVLIGRALMAKPALLILDEPCAGLDPVEREHFLQFVQKLGSKRGERPSSRGERPVEGPSFPTLVLVTHHVEEVMPMFTHALVLKHGHIVAQGPKRDVLNSRSLSDAFETPVRLREVAGCYSLLVPPTSRVI